MRLRISRTTGAIFALALALPAILSAQLTIEWSKDCKGCGEHWNKGFHWRTLQIPSATIWTSVEPFDEYWSVSVIYYNDTAVPVHLLVDSIGFKVLDRHGKPVPTKPVTKAEFIKRNSGLGAAQNIANVIDAIVYPGAPVANGTIRNSDGTYSRINIYDPNVPSPTQQAAEYERRRRSELVSVVTRNMLENQTVMPGQIARGVLYYRRHKSARSAVLTLPVMSVTVSIPFPFWWK